MTQPPQDYNSPFHLLSLGTASLDNRLVFLDPMVEDANFLLKAIAAEDTAIRLEAHQDGVAQISAALAKNLNVSTIHLITQGSPGCLCLGSSQLSLKTLDFYAWDLQTWFSTLPLRSPTPTLFLYGSNVAEGEAGTEFLARLHQLTQAAIAVLVRPSDSVGAPQWQFASPASKKL